MTDQKVMAVFGLPGVGKTTAIQEVEKKRSDVVRLSGGSLINADLSEQERDMLRELSKDSILSKDALINSPKTLPLLKKV